MKRSHDQKFCRVELDLLGNIGIGFFARLPLCQHLPMKRYLCNACFFFNFRLVVTLNHEHTIQDLRAAIVRYFLKFALNFAYSL